MKPHSNKTSNRPKKYLTKKIKLEIIDAMIERLKKERAANKNRFLFLCCIFKDCIYDECEHVVEGIRITSFSKIKEVKLLHDYWVKTKRFPGERANRLGWWDSHLNYISRHKFLVELKAVVKNGKITE